MGSQGLSNLNDTVILKCGLSQQCALAALKASIQVSRDAQRKDWKQQSHVAIRKIPIVSEEKKNLFNVICDSMRLWNLSFPRGSKFICLNS